MEPDATALLRKAERTMVRVRWFAAAFGLLQVLMYYLPYPRGVRDVALGLVAALVAGNVAIWAAHRRVTRPAAVRLLALASLAFDFVLVMGFVAVYTFDVNTAMFALVYVLPLEGAIRFGRVGAIATMVAATAVYAAREWWGHVEYGHPFLWTSISFRMGIGLIIAAVAGAIAGRYAFERGRAGALSLSERVATSRLARSQKMLARAQEVAQVGSWEWSIPEDELTWSEELYRLYGLNPGSEISFDEFIARVHPDDRARVIETIDEARRGGHEFAFDHRVVHPDGTVRVLHGQGSVERDDGGDARCMVGTAQDVTEARAQEQALVESGRRYAEAYERERLIAARLRELDAIGDAQRQRQVLANLVGNALKFSPADAPVEVRVRSRNDGLYQVDVTDHGIGIAAADLPRLFGKFERIERPAADGSLQPRGSGLGLYITRNLVEMQGGTVDVQSTPGEGSTFSYTVPARSRSTSRD